MLRETILLSVVKRSHFRPQVYRKITNRTPTTQHNKLTIFTAITKGYMQQSSDSPAATSLILSRVENSGPTWIRHDIGSHKLQIPLTRTYTLAHIYNYLCMYICTYIDVYIGICTCNYVRICMYTHIYIYIIYTVMEGRGGECRDTQHRRRHERSSTAHGNTPIYRLTRTTSARNITRYR